MTKLLSIRVSPIRLCLYCLIITTVFFIFNENVIAATVDQKIIEKIISKYHTLGSTWGSNIKSHSLWLLKIMLTIQLIWMALKLGLKQSTLHNLIEEFVIVVFFGSVFFCLIIYSQDYSDKLISGMSSLSVQVAGSGSSATDVFTNSLKIADNMTNPISIFGAVKAPLIGLCIIVTLLCGAFIYGMYILIACEAWIILNIGILLLGFGGLKASRGFSTSFLKYALGVGLKVFTIKCLFYVLAIFMADMINYYFEDLSEVLVITASFLILAFLVKTLPDAMARIVTIHSGSSAGAMTGAMIAGAGMAVGAASMGVGAAAGAAGGGGISGALGGAKNGPLSAIERALKSNAKKKESNEGNE